MKKLLIFTLISFLLISCSSNNDSSGITPENLFKVETYSVVNVGHQSATVFGTFGPSFLADVTAYGICYGLSANPTVNGTHTIELNFNEATGTFSSSLLSLSQNTTYYVRAYGTTSNGTFYGDQRTFSTLSQLYTNGGAVVDADGNSYSSIVINGKQWMKGNLNVSKYRNGDIIPEVTDIAEWDALTTGAWCYYSNDSANGTTYGKLYNWYAVNDPRGLAPAGWHIPTDSEWTSLITFLGGANVAGSKIKDSGTLWSDQTQGATNQSGFTAIPAGYGYLTLTYTPDDQPFKSLGDAAYWWSATASGTNTAYSVDVRLGNTVTQSSIRNKTAISVRCVRN
jgi:uncharacterized protein (TIGR02145 family)